MSSETISATEPRQNEDALRWAHLQSRLFKAICFVAAIVGTTALVVLIGDVIWEAYRAVTEFGIDIISFLTSPGSAYATDAGLFASVVGSIWLMILTALFTFGVGVGTALYLEEYAPENRWKRLIEINLANLAGVPSVVYGLVVLGLLVHIIGFSAIILVGAVALALTVMPIVIVSAQEAIRAVPDSLRDASYAMGASRWQTIKNVVLPAAMPGILTGMILSIADAWGQTAPIIMVGVLMPATTIPWTPFDRTAAVTATVFEWTFSFDSEFRALAALGIMVLLIILVVLNGTAIYLRHRFDTEVQT